MDGGSECCGKYKKKGKACRDCPVLAELDKKARKKLLRKYHRRHERRKAA